MNDLENKLKQVLSSMNATFNISIEDISDIDGEQIANKLLISDINNDGSDFLEAFCSLFGPLITLITKEEKELVYQLDTGLVIQHKQIIDDNLANVDITTETE